MPQYKFVVLTNAVEGQEDAYNDWYTRQHLGDVLRVPSLVAAQRFEIAPGASDAAFRYLAIYDIETNDLQATLDGINSRAGTDAMPLSSAMAEQYSAIAYEAITPRVVSVSRPSVLKAVGAEPG